MNHRMTGLVCIAAIILFDQSSIAVALSMSEPRGGIEVLPMLNLVLFRNDGVSFGLLSGLAPWWALTALGVLISLVLGIWFWRAQSRLLAVALGLMIGGALGNIFDRVRYGAVTDFLDFHFAGYHWPAFNFADTAIFFGVVLVLFDSCRKTRGRME